MPRVELSAGAFRDGDAVEKFEALTVEKGDTHRLWIPSQKHAWMELRHQIKAPVFLENGEPLKTTDRNGQVVFDMGYKVEGAYIGSPICLSDPEVYARHQLDPGNCPACAGVKRLADGGFGDAVKDLAPVQRYALPVVRYETVSKQSTTPRDPAAAKILVWPLGQYGWEQLDNVRKDMAELLQVDDWKTIDLSQCDISVANKEGFGKLEIKALRRFLDQPTDLGQSMRKTVKALWFDRPENRPTDAQLRAACGREPNRTWMERDIRAAEDRWARAVNHGRHRPADPTGEGSYLANGHKAASLSDALDELDGGAAGSAPASPLDGLDEFASAPSAGSAAPAGDPFADDPFGAPAAPVTAQAQRAAAPAAAPSLRDVFDDVFDGGGSAPAAAPSLDAAFETVPARTAVAEEDPFDAAMREAR
jgi:hypothetical protein